MKDEEIDHMIDLFSGRNLEAYLKAGEYGIENEITWVDLVEHSIDPKTPENEDEWIERAEGFETIFELSQAMLMYLKEKR